MTKLMPVLTGIILLSSTYAFGGEIVCSGKFDPISVADAKDDTCNIGLSPTCDFIDSRDKNDDKYICFKITQNGTGGFRFKDNTLATK